MPSNSCSATGDAGGELFGAFGLEHGVFSQPVRHKHGVGTYADPQAHPLFAEGVLRWRRKYIRLLYGGVDQGALGLGPVATKVNVGEVGWGEDRRQH